MIKQKLKPLSLLLFTLALLLCHQNSAYAINKGPLKKEAKSKKKFLQKVKEKALANVVNQGFLKKPADLSKKELLLMWLGCWLAAFLIYGLVYLFLRDATGDLLIATLGLILLSVGLVILGALYGLAFLSRLVLG